jgi:hypothetical protein
MKPRELETAGGSRIAAYRSLARSRGVSLDVVLRAAADDRLRDIVEIRARSKISPGRGPGFGIRDPWDALTLLAFKKNRSF